MVRSSARIIVFLLWRAPILSDATPPRLPLPVGRLKGDYFGVRRASDAPG